MTDSVPISPEPHRRSVQLPWRLEVVLSALIVTSAAVYSPIGADDPYEVEAAGRLWFALTVFFFWMTGLRILRDRRTPPSAGELLGLYPVMYWFVVLWATWIPPNGHFAFLLLMGGIPIYFILSLISGGFLLATIAGKRRQVLYKFIDVLGLFVNTGGGVLLFVDLRMHPIIV